MAVEQSMTMLPGRRPCRMPSGPVSTASTWGEPVTTRITMSTRAASAVALCTLCTPAALSWSSGWLPGCSSTTSSWPCLTRLLAMPCPIMPRPTMPIFIASPL